MAVGLEEVINGSAVAGDDSLESPVIAQYMLQVAGVAAAGFSVDALVGTHHLLYAALLHQSLEGWQIGLPQVSLR